MLVNHIMATQCSQWSKVHTETFIPAEENVFTYSLYQKKGEKDAGKHAWHHKLYQLVSDQSQGC